MKRSEYQVNTKRMKMKTTTCTKQNLPFKELSLIIVWYFFGDSKEMNPSKVSIIEVSMQSVAKRRLGLLSVLAYVGVLVQLHSHQPARGAICLVIKIPRKAQVILLSASRYTSISQTGSCQEKHAQGCYRRAY